MIDKYFYILITHHVNNDISSFIFKYTVNKKNSNFMIFLDLIENCF